MIDADKYSKRKTVPTIKLLICPACNKKRLGKYVNEDGTVDEVSSETVEVRGENRYLDVCEFCIVKYQKQDQKFIKENLRKLSKAIVDDATKDDESDHRDFSLN